jgi:hypothetical protein
MRKRRGVLVGEPRERDHLEELGVDGKIIANSNLQYVIRRTWTGFMWLRIGAGAWHLKMW